jgi:hypothetical protein
MTDVSNLDDLANKIASGKYPNIAQYAKAQAAATQSQEIEIRKLREDVEMLKRSVSPPPDGGVGPTPVSGGRGVGYIRYGGGAADSHVADYDLRLVARYDTIYANYPPSILYVSGVHCAPASGTKYGVTLEEARANSWILRDASGNEIPNGSFGSYLADVGSATYQARWCENVLDMLNDWGYEGLFNDDCAGGEIVGAPASSQPALYPTDSDWHDAMLEFVVAVGDYFKTARGMLVAHNAGKWLAGDAGNNDASNKKEWWTEIGPYSTHLMDEGWMVGETTSNPDVDDLRRSGGEWWNNWTNYQGLVDHAYSVGCAPICLTRGTTTRRLGYAFASFLLDWEPASGGVFMWRNPDYVSGIAWPTQFDSLPGFPTGAKSLGGDTWSRSYEAGTVSVNPVAGTYAIPGW